MKRYAMPPSMLMLLLLLGCGGHENDKIETDDIKENNTLIVPTCLP
ncbi:MAG: hypothetical protein LBP41_03560 [Holosporaceae bacterium]|nr:hypothetical protein [Holosporaceae bacterium]